MALDLGHIHQSTHRESEELPVESACNRLANARFPDSRHPEESGGTHETLPSLHPLRLANPWRHGHDRRARNGTDDRHEQHTMGHAGEHLPECAGGQSESGVTNEGGVRATLR